MWLSIAVRLILLVVLWIVATILLQKLLVFYERVRLCYVTCNRGETDIEEAFF